MPKYLIQASYTSEGIKGLLNDGGSKRREISEQAAKGLGGTLDVYYFAFGEGDVYAILDMPDNVTMAAAALAVAAGGTVKIKTTVLITPEEVDEAAQKTVSYRPPGQ